MTTAMGGGVTGATITAIRNGVAITIGMAMGIRVTDLDISNPIPTRNLSTSRHQCTIRHSNRPASVCFFRLIFIGRYHLKQAHANAIGWINEGSSLFAIDELPT